MERVSHEHTYALEFVFREGDVGGWAPPPALEASFFGVKQENSTRKGGAGFVCLSVCIIFVHVDAKRGGRYVKAKGRVR